MIRKRKSQKLEIVAVMVVTILKTNYDKMLCFNEFEKEICRQVYKCINTDPDYVL